MIERLNCTIGTQLICAWQPALGITWVQTRCPKLARKLDQRDDGSLVARGVAGGYLRTFEFRQPLAWAQRWIDRHTKNETATNEAFSSLNAPQTNFVGRNDSTVPGLPEEGRGAV